MTAAEAILPLTVILTSGCGPETPRYYRNGYASQFDYDIRPTMVTPAGIRVDPTGQQLDIEKIDRQVDEVERCLEEAFGDPPRIPDEVMDDAECRWDDLDLPLHREWLIVKVPDDWLYSCDGSQLVLPALAPETGCLAKGQHPTAECPCRWRGGIQDDRYIVTTPAFYIYKDPIIRMVTGCNNPWYSPPLATCATPSVPPLP
jgi:hypothetical protein